MGKELLLHLIHQKCSREDVVKGTSIMKSPTLATLQPIIKLRRWRPAQDLFWDQYITQNGKDSMRVEQEKMKGAEIFSRVFGDRKSRTPQVQIVHWDFLPGSA